MHSQNHIKFQRQFKERQMSLFFVFTAKFLLNQFLYIGRLCL